MDCLDYMDILIFMLVFSGAVFYSWLIASLLINLNEYIKKKLTTADEVIFTFTSSDKEEDGQADQQDQEKPRQRRKRNKKTT